MDVVFGIMAIISLGVLLTRKIEGKVVVALTVSVVMFVASWNYSVVSTDYYAANVVGDIVFTNPTMINETVVSYPFSTRNDSITYKVAAGANL